MLAKISNYTYHRVLVKILLGVAATQTVRILLFALIGRVECNLLSSQGQPQCIVVYLIPLLMILSIVAIWVLFRSVRLPYGLGVAFLLYVTSCYLPTVLAHGESSSLIYDLLLPLTDLSDPAGVSNIVVQIGVMPIAAATLGSFLWSKRRPTSMQQ